MVCQFCKEREAKVHLWGNGMASGVKKEWKIDLCSECAKEKGVNDPSSFEITKLLLEMTIKK
jgi:protein-arginine kinase activator protein McsA